MSDLSIEMKEYAFQAAVQAAVKRAGDSSCTPQEAAVQVAEAALGTARALGMATSRISQPARSEAQRDDR